MKQLIEALQAIAAMDPEGQRADDLGRAAALARHALVDMPRAVGSIHHSHLQPPTGPWCKEVLLYSPDNKLDGPTHRVMLYA